MDLNLLFIAYSRFDKIQYNLNNIDLKKISKIFIYIDGPKNIDIKNKQIEFVKNCDKDIAIKSHEKNLGVRDFVPYAISDVFNYSNNLLIMEDDIVISSVSIDFISSNFHHLENHMISLFSPLKIKANIITYDGGIWGWCISKRLWSNFNWTQTSVFLIFKTLLIKVGFIKALFYAPLIYLSKEDRIKSWAYNWFYNRIQSDIKSIVPHQTMAINLGIGDKNASSTRRQHKFNQLILSDSVCSTNKEENISLHLNTGFSKFEIFLRLFYNWIRLLYK